MESAATFVLMGNALWKARLGWSLWGSAHAPVRGLGMADRECFPNTRMGAWAHAQCASPSSPPTPIEGETPPTPNPLTATSPFHVGGPIEDDADFYGRHAAARYVLDRLTKGECVSIVGERRIGKSSLLCYIQRQVPQLRSGRGPCTTVYLDLTRPSARARRGVMRALRRQLETTGTLSVWAKAEDGDLLALEDALDDWRMAGKSLLLLLDEVDRLTERAAEFNDMLDLWRVFGQGPVLNIVTASRLPLPDLVAQGNLSSPFPNIFIEWCLGLLKDAEWQRLVRERFTSRGLGVPPGALDWVADMAGGGCGRRWRPRWRGV